MKQTKKREMAQAKDTKATPKQQFNVYLPPDLVKRMKHQAIEQGEFLSGLVERIFEDYLEKEQR